MRKCPTCISDSEARGGEYLVGSLDKLGAFWATSVDDGHIMRCTEEARGWEAVLGLMERCATGCGSESGIVG